MKDLAAVLEHAKRTNIDLPEPKLPPITRVDVDGIDVAHIDTGMGEPGAPTYLLVHGLGGSLANWEAVIPFLLAETPRPRVLVPDLAGFGRTEADPRRTGVDDNADLVADYIRLLDLDRVVIAGNSMGGMIAALLAARHPELVDRLVLIDPVLPLHPRTPPHWAVAATFGLYLCGPLARAVIPWYAGRIGLERMGVDGLRNVIHDPARVPRWIVRRAVEETVAHAEAQGAVASLVTAARSIVMCAGSPRYRRALGRIRVPVSLVHGSADGLVPVKAAQTAARRFPSWWYLEAQDVGHVPMAEVAEWVAGVIVTSPSSLD